MVSTRKNFSELPKIIHVEDDELWRKSVSEFIARSGRIAYSEIICGSSLEDIEGELQATHGPVVIIMDLQLGGEGNLDFEGYRWILEDLEGFLERNASTLIFVLSGQLHAGIEATLLRKGVPKDHIFGKDEWATKRNRFIDVLECGLASLDERVIDHIARGFSGHNIDPHLIHLNLLAVEGTILPMVVHARSSNWVPRESPKLRILGNIGSFFSCLGDEGSLAALERDPGVLSIEASRSALKSVAPIQLVEFSPPEILSEETGNAAVVGIIGHIRLSVLAEKIVDFDVSRIAAVWDQTDPTGPPPSPDLPGTVYFGDKIRGLLEDARANRGTYNAYETYAATLLSQIAVGSRVVLVIPASGLRIPHEDSVPGLGFAVSHLIAIQFIQEQVERLGKPCIIQVLQGMSAGSHDGSSLIERAFDTAVSSGQFTECPIVVSVGDERRRCGHARISMVTGQREELPFEIKDGCSRCGIELWFSPHDEYSFRVIAPDGSSSDYVRSVERRMVGTFPDGSRYAVSYSRIMRQNDDGCLVLTVLSEKPTALERGEWILEIGAVRAREGEIEAWLDRLSADEVIFTDHVDTTATLLVPSTAKKVISVGALKRASPLQPSRFSSYGPTRDGRKKPDVAAQGECSLVATARFVGMLTRAMSTRFRENSDLSVAEILEASHRNPWHPAMGFGVWNRDEILSISKSVGIDRGSQEQAEAPEEPRDELA